MDSVAKRQDLPCQRPLVVKSINQPSIPENSSQSRQALCLQKPSKYITKAQSRRHVLDQLYQAWSGVALRQHRHHYRVVFDHPGTDGRPQPEVEIRRVPQCRAEEDPLGRLKRQNALGVDSTVEVAIFDKSAGTSSCESSGKERKQQMFRIIQFNKEAQLALQNSQLANKF